MSGRADIGQLERTLDARAANARRAVILGAWLVVALATLAATPVPPPPTPEPAIFVLPCVTSPEDARCTEFRPNILIGQPTVDDLREFRMAEELLRLRATVDAGSLLRLRLHEASTEPAPSFPALDEPSQRMTVPERSFLEELRQERDWSKRPEPPSSELPSVLEDLAELAILQGRETLGPEGQVIIQKDNSFKSHAAVEAIQEMIAYQDAIKAAWRAAVRYEHELSVDRREAWKASEAERLEAVASRPFNVLVALSVVLLALAAAAGLLWRTRPVRIRVDVGGVQLDRHDVPVTRLRAVSVSDDRLQLELDDGRVASSRPVQDATALREVVDVVRVLIESPSEDPGATDAEAIRQGAQQLRDASKS